MKENDKVIGNLGVEMYSTMGMAFAVAVVNGENMAKWTITLLLAVGYVVLGIMGIIDYKSNK